MALTVYDGTTDTWDSLASVATSDAYHLARNRTGWAAADNAQKEAALIDATVYLCGLSWIEGAGPTVGDSVPAAVVKACCEMAGEIVAGNNPLAVQGRAMSEMSVGPISISYEQGAAKAPTFPAVTALLRGLVYSSGTIRMVR